MSTATCSRTFLVALTIEAETETDLPDADQLSRIIGNSTIAEAIGEGCPGDGSAYVANAYIPTADELVPLMGECAENNGWPDQGPDASPIDEDAEEPDQDAQDCAGDDFGPDDVIVTTAGRTEVVPGWTVEEILRREG